MIGRSESQRYFSSRCAPCFSFSFPIRNFVTAIIESCAHLHESDRTLRDGSFGWRCPRHFVPGYDRTVPPGRVLVLVLVLESPASSEIVASDPITSTISLSLTRTARVCGNVSCQAAYDSQ
jgi:hypothetical protein